MKYNKILQEDVQDLAKNGPILKELKNVTILITGATGSYWWSVCFYSIRIEPPV